MANHPHSDESLRRVQEEENQMRRSHYECLALRCMCTAKAKLRASNF